MTEQNLRRYLNPPASTPYPLEYAFHLLGDIADRAVLDYGCGSGENCVALALRGAHVIGLDLSSALLELADTRMRLNGVAGKAEFIAGSAHAVPLPDNSVDCIFGIAVLHHLDLDLAAQEIHRLLKPGGRAIFQEPVRNSRIVKAIRRAIPYRRDDVSPYERPLNDVELARFSRGLTPGRTRVFSLPFVNLAQVVPGVKEHLLEIYRADGAVLRAMPFLGRFAGVRVFELLKSAA